MTDVTVRDLVIGNTRPLTIIAGPCQLESEDHAQMIAGRMKGSLWNAGERFAQLRRRLVPVCRVLGEHAHHDGFERIRYAGL